VPKLENEILYGLRVVMGYIPWAGKVKRKRDQRNSG
jgi:hypothetical protein